MDMQVTGSRLWMINFYKEQLNKFEKVGLGKLTENDVKVSPELIQVTRKRLDQLTVVYDSTMTPQALKLRRLKAIKKMKERSVNGQQANSNGATTTQGRKDNSDTGHETGKS